MAAAPIHQERVKGLEREASSQLTLPGAGRSIQIVRGDLPEGSSARRGIWSCKSVTVEHVEHLGPQAQLESFVRTERHFLIDAHVLGCNAGVTKLIQVSRGVAECVVCWVAEASAIEVTLTHACARIDL